jgi:hypothetical protein
MYIWSSFSPAFETDTFWRGFLVTGLMTSPVHIYIGNINWTGQWPSSQWTCYSFCYNNNNNCTETWSIRKVTMSLQPDTQRKKGYKSTGRRRREDSLFMVRKNKRRRDSLSKRRKLVRQDISSPLIDDSPPSTIYIPVRVTYMMQDWNTDLLF